MISAAPPSKVSIESAHLLKPYRNRELPSLPQNDPTVLPLPSTNGLPNTDEVIAPGEHSVGHLPVEDDGGLLRRGETDVECHPAVNDGNPAQRRGDCPLDPPEIRNNAEALQRIVVYERTTRTREGEVVLIERFGIPPPFDPCQLLAVLARRT